MSTTKTFDVTVIDSGNHNLDGHRGELEINYGPAVIHATFRPCRGKHLTWQVHGIERGFDILCVNGPNTNWRFTVNCGG